jgi:hypothetical protein
VVGDVVRAVVGDVADDDPLPPRRLEVDVVEADADAHERLAARHRRERPGVPDEVVPREDRVGRRVTPA